MFIISTIDPTVGLGYSFIKSKCRLTEKEYFTIIEKYSQCKENSADDIADIVFSAYNRKHSKKKLQMLESHKDLTNTLINMFPNYKDVFDLTEKVMNEGRVQFTFGELINLLNQTPNVCPEDLFLTKEHFVRFTKECDDLEYETCNYSFHVYDFLKRYLKGIKSKYRLKDFLDGEINNE